ncbi:NifU family protein [Nocardia takedensis]
MTRSLAALAAAGRLRPRDLDAIMIAYGYLSRAAIENFLADPQQGSEPNLLDGDIQTVAQELVDRICGCQVQDGGRTEMVSCDSNQVHLRVAGACIHCPQIIYTIGILEDALHHRLPGVDSVVVDGTALEIARRKPENAQLTMPMVMRTTGMTFGDLDQELERKDILRDEDLIRLARRCALRMQAKSDTEDAK